MDFPACEGQGQEGERHGGEVEGYEAVEEEGERVVDVVEEGVGARVGVGVVGVEGGEAAREGGGGGWVVQEVAVDKVGEGFAEGEEEGEVLGDLPGEGEGGCGVEDGAGGCEGEEGGEAGFGGGGEGEIEEGQADEAGEGGGVAGGEAAGAVVLDGFGEGGEEGVDEEEEEGGD